MSRFKEVANQQPTTTLRAEEAQASPAFASLSNLQQELVNRTALANSPGNLDGLFAFHMGGNESALPITWNVSCATEEWLEENAARITHFPVVAAMGYSLRHLQIASSSSLRGAFLDGVAKLRLRDPFPEDRVSFAYQPKAFLGLAVGIVAVGGLGTELRTWLIHVLADRRHGEATQYHTLLYGCIRHELIGEAMPISEVHSYTSPHELALLQWGVQHGALRLLDPSIDLSQPREHSVAAF